VPVPGEREHGPGAQDAAEAPRLADALSGLPGIGAGTSCFAEQLAPGIAVAWDPRDPRVGWNRMSFGQHRAAAVAEGVMRHHTQGDVDLAEAVAVALAAASADAARPALNLTSPQLPSAPALSAAA